MNGLRFKLKVNDFLCIKREFKQYRFPKTKRVRIRNKWAKRKSNFKMMDVHISFRIGDTIWVSSFPRLAKVAILTTNADA